MAKGGHPHLREVPGCGRDLQRAECSSESLIAASPFGAAVRPCSMSHTEAGDLPISDAISESLRPSARSSRTICDHLPMGDILWHSIANAQCHPITEFHENRGMTERKPLGPRPQEPYATIGQRIAAWRQYRGYKRPEFARLIGIPYPTLAGLEAADQKGSTRLHDIAAKLSVNVHYLASGKGEPEDLSWRPDNSVPEEWNFLEELKEKISEFNEIERDVIHLSVLKAIQKVENGRKQRKSSTVESAALKKEQIDDKKNQRRNSPRSA